MSEKKIFFDILVVFSRLFVILAVSRRFSKGPNSQND